MSEKRVTIANLMTTAYGLPMYGRLQWGQQHVMEGLAQHVLVRVRLSNGAEGVAEALPRPTIYGETSSSIINIIEQELKPRLIGKPPANLSAIYQIKNNHSAKAALDMAVQDALAQSAGVSLADYLARAAHSDGPTAGRTPPATRIPVSYILGIGDDDTVLAEAQAVFDQGVRVLKVKVGRDWAGDVRRIALLQAMFGPAMAIYADANECLTAVHAPQQLAQLAEMGVLYCEEPLPVEQVRQRASLRAGGHLPLIADDSCFTERDLRRELALDTFDILNIKTARTGYTESLRMLTLARQVGKQIMVGSQAGAALGAARATIFAALPGIECPSEVSFFLKLQGDIVAQRPLIHEGFVSVAEMLAVKVDEGRLREFEIEA